METSLSGNEKEQFQGDGNRQATRSLASLPEALQKAIREALQGLPPQDRDKQHRHTTPSSPRQLALKPSDGSKQTDFSITGENLPKGKEQHAASGRGQSGDNKGGSPSGKGAGAQPIDQGSGIQQLGRARLDRKNTRGSFQPDSPQIPGSGGQSGAGGPGAGSGTDPRLFGNQANLGGGANKFQLALDATYEKGGASDTEEDVGSVVEKSGRELSRRQSLDDAIRKSQIPAEYEEIVKQLFSRGESQ